MLSDGMIQLDTVLSPAMLTKFAAGGTQTYSVQLDKTGNTGGGEITMLPDGRVAVLRKHHGHQMVAGGVIEVYSTAGALEWSIDKFGARTGPGAAISGLADGEIAVTGTGKLVLLAGGAGGWPSVLETFAP